MADGRVPKRRRAYLFRSECTMNLACRIFVWAGFAGGFHLALPAREVIRTAAELRALTVAEAKQALPVEIEVVVTFVDQSR
jgi:hypothetical protein